MEKEDRDTIQHMSETLDKIFAVLSAPQSRLVRIAEFVATGVTLLGIIGIIDIIKSWIGG